jgi:hypothetical protein
MLRSDGFSLTDEAESSYMTFLASQISDLIAYFVSRNIRSTGMVDLTGNVDENSNERPLQANSQQLATGHVPHPGALTQLRTPNMVPPRLDMSSGSDSHVFEPWVFPETYSTPVMDPPAHPPVSGVRMNLLDWIVHYLLPFYMYFLALLSGISTSSRPSTSDCIDRGDCSCFEQFL